jgi:hypothetical protein
MRPTYKKWWQGNAPSINLMHKNWMAVRLDKKSHLHHRTMVCKTHFWHFINNLCTVTTIGFHHFSTSAALSSKTLSAMHSVLAHSVWDVSRHHAKTLKINDYDHLNWETNKLVVFNWVLNMASAIHVQFEHDYFYNPDCCHQWWKLLCKESWQA